MGFFNPTGSGGGSGSLIPGTTVVSGGTNGGILWDNAGVLASGPALTDTSGNLALPASASIGFNANGKITTIGDGLFRLTNNAGT